MKKYLRHRHQRGFTLVELVVVIAIMAILASSVTAAVIGIARSTTENNNKSTVRNYFGMTRAAMNQINSGVSIYSNGTFTTTADIATLLKRTTGYEPRQVVRLEDTQSAERMRPLTTDEEGFYVGVRFADPSIGYPLTSGVVVDDTAREFFVDAVYFVSDGVCYGMVRSSSDVSVYK